MSLKHLDRSFVFLAFRLPCGPDVCLAIFAAAYDILGVIAERSMYLTARILVTLKLKLQTFVSQIIDANSRVIAGYEQFDFSVRVFWGVIDGLYSSDFASLGIFAMSRAHMNLRLVFQALCFIE